MIRTFLDAGVLIAGIRGDLETVERVLAIRNDPERAFVASDFVRLEVLPKALYFRQQAEAAFYEAYFATVVEMVEVSPALVAQAYDEAQRAGLGSMDALHVAAAQAAGVTEFITVENGTDEESRFRPIPDPMSQGRSPWLEVSIESREHLTWASEQAKRYVLDVNDWCLSICNQGILTKVWLSATRYVHKDSSSDVWVPTTSEGSSRLTASHDILGLRSVDLAYDLTDRQMRGICLRRDNWALVRYAEGLNASKSSASLQSTDRHEILDPKPTDFQLSL